VALVDVGVFVGVGVGYDITIVGPLPFELVIVSPLESVISITTSPVSVKPLGVLIFGCYSTTGNRIRSNNDLKTIDTV
jgi:hypothetical protein